MPFRASPGGILAAAQAMNEPRQAYSRAQTEYFVCLAYQTGWLHGLATSMSDNAGPWVPDETPQQIRARRVRERLAEYGPATTGYRGGPVDWDTGLAVR